MPREVIRTPRAPAPIGPYSQAVKTGAVVYVSGQIPLDPATGQLVQGDIQAQTRQVLENLRAIIEAAGLSMAQVVRTTIFITDMADFPAINQIYQQAFSEPFPARSTVQVSRLPAGAAVEIDAIAVND